MNMVRTNLRSQSHKKVGGTTRGITLAEFMAGRRRYQTGLSYVSLFAGGGIGDFGLQRAGYHCVASSELDPLRASVLAANSKGHQIFGDIREEGDVLVSYVKKKERNLDVLVATPPCQSFSTANARRGKNDCPRAAAKDIRNSLFFYALDVINRLRPKVAVIENVPNFFSRKIASLDGRVTGAVGEFTDAILQEYVGYRTTICMSDFGVPQRRKRAVGIFCRNDIVNDIEAWADGTHPALPQNWIAPIMRNGFRSLTAEEALSQFPPLDGARADLARSEIDPLHQVPTYNDVHYRWISEIPPGSGLGAYDNDQCPACNNRKVPKGKAFCSSCGAEMTNRPHVVDKESGFRLVKGFKTSYRRMRPDIPAATVTTSSSHFGSDLKLHPFENRVLSIRECCYLQTVPDTFDWTPAIRAGRPYAIRQMVGEAIPAWFSFQLGEALRKSVFK